MNQAGVKIAREAREVAGRDVLVAGSIGPLGTRPNAGSRPEQMAEALYGPGGRARGSGRRSVRARDVHLARGAGDRRTRRCGRQPRPAGHRPGDRARTTPRPRPGRRRRRPCGARGARAVAVGVNCSLGPQTVLAGLERDARGHRPAADGAGERRDAQRTATGACSTRTRAPSTSASTPPRRSRSARVVIGGCCGTPAGARGRHPAGRRASGGRRPWHLQPVERELPTPGGRRDRRARAGWRKLAAGEWVVSVELDPPKGGNVERLIATRPREPRSRGRGRRLRRQRQPAGPGADERADRPRR